MLQMRLELVKESTPEALVEACQEAINNGRQLHGTPFWGVEAGTDGCFCQIVTVMVNTKL